MLFNKKRVSKIDNDNEVLDKKVEGVIRYAHIYSGFYYSQLSKQYSDFKSVADEYSFAFMELYTVAALAVSIHSPAISRTQTYNDVLVSIKKQIRIYFENSKNDLSLELVNCIDFYNKYSSELFKLKYNFSDISAYWLLDNFSVYKDFVKNYDLINELGNELTNHYIYIFEDTWVPREIKPTEIHNKT